MHFTVTARSLFFSGLLGLFLFNSCKQEVKPLSAEEVKDFARKLETSVNKRETQFFDDAIDRNSLIKRANIPSGKNARDFKRGLNSGMNMGTTMKQSLSAKATYTLVKQYEKDKVHHLLFRLYDNGSLNYHDLELTRSGKDVKVADMFIYTTGENLSETLHGIYLQLAGMFDDKTSKITPNDEWLKKLPDIRKLMREGKNREAADLFNKIPGQVRKGRAFQILHVEVSSGLSYDEYNDAIEEYKRLFPNEPNMHLLLLDGYIIQKQYDKALNAVNELDKMINKDPFLDYYRYLCYKLLQDEASGKECLVRLVKAMPGFEEGVLELIAVYLDENDYEAARPLVVNYKSRSSFDQSALDQLLEQHPGFTE